MRFTLAHETKLAPHTHSDVWRIAAVFSGTLDFGIGETVDEAKLTAFPAGTVFTEQPELVHFAYAKAGPGVLQLTTMGLAGTALFEPAE